MKKINTHYLPAGPSGYNGIGLSSLRDQMTEIWTEIRYFYGSREKLKKICFPRFVVADKPDFVIPCLPWSCTQTLKNLAMFGPWRVGNLQITR